MPDATPNPIDVQEFRLKRSDQCQRIRHRFCTLDPARRKWYNEQRTKRYARMLMGLSA